MPRCAGKEAPDNTRDVSLTDLLTEYEVLWDPPDGKGQEAGQSRGSRLRRERPGGPGLPQPRLRRTGQRTPASQLTALSPGPCKGESSPEQARPAPRPSVQGGRTQPAAPRTASARSQPYLPQARATCQALPGPASATTEAEEEVGRASREAGQPLSPGRRYGGQQPASSHKLQGARL